ncbi:MAG: IS66 family insertion sequence element accessory protein TnpA [Thiobacillaceae bacterium]
MAKRHGAEFWRRHLEAWHRSDLTQREYCATYGLGERAFCRWRRKEKAAAAAKSSLTLVPVSMGTPVTGSVVRLTSPGGWRIEIAGGSAPWLGDCLRQLP